MDLPGGGNHWMRNIELSPDGTGSMSRSVRSATSARGMEIEEGRAMIHEYDLASKRSRQFARGLRNPNGLDWNPWSGELWTTVNERDMLGSDLVPDYLTNVPVGAQYGWPWVYGATVIDRGWSADAALPHGIHPQARICARPARRGAGAGVHASEGSRMGEGFASGAFIARHGSWNRKPPSGYDVVFVAFDDRGNPVGKPVPVLTELPQERRRRPAGGRPGSNGTATARCW
jgi:glucose/arabinose dehydrogenase